MTMVSELVLTRNQLLEIVRRHEDSEFKAPLQRLSNVTAELQEGVMKTRMQPIGNAWQKLPRIVRDLSAELGKQIELEMHGAETELDRQVLDLIKDPLTHMVRNSRRPRPRDAGRAARRRQARTRHASACRPVTRAATSSSRSPTTAAGSTSTRIKAKAIAQGLASRSRDREAVGSADPQIHLRARLLDGRRQVTSVSGRGVGMDVVRNNIDQIGGTIDVKSVAGAGIELHDQDPAHACDRLRADRRGGRRALRHPAARGASNWCARATAFEHRIERIKDTPVLRLRDKLLPLVAPQAPARARQATPASRRTASSSSTQVGSQTLRHRRRRRVPHRGDRGQADVERSCATSTCSPATPFSATAR